LAECSYSYHALSSIPKQQYIGYYLTDCLLPDAPGEDEESPRANIWSWMLHKTTDFFLSYLSFVFEQNTGYYLSKAQ
jgi:hypothetical protein